MEKLNIYNNGRLLEHELRRLEKSSVSEKNKADIKKYQKYLLANNVGTTRVVRISIELRKLALLLAKDFADASKPDMEELVSKVNQNTRYSPATIASFKQILKQFYKFLKGNREEFPIEVRWIDTTIKNKDKKTFEEMIHPQEISNVIYCCENVRDKAFISLLYETGARIGEMLNMRVKDFRPNGNHAKVRFFGKTGERLVPIVSSVSSINRLLEKHPFRNDPNSFLWLSESAFHKNQPLLYIGATKLIRRTFNAAGLKKRFNPHTFRHSRATELAQYLTEVQMCLYFGWAFGTKQVRNYVHASGREVDETILRINGIETKTKEERKTICCHRCGTMNNGSNFCKACGYALDVQSTIRMEEQVKEETNKAFELLMEISKNPALLREFEEFKAKFALCTSDG